MDAFIENINKHGFVFHKYDTCLIEDNLNVTAQNLFKYINSLISVEGENLSFDFDTIQKGQEIKPHFHIIPGSFQVVVWLPYSPFEGRDYLYGTNKLLRRFKPQKGFMCFMKPNDPNFIHGVSKLLSDEPITTVGFSSLASPFEKDKNYDIFVDGYKISDELVYPDISI